MVSLPPAPTGIVRVCVMNFPKLMWGSNFFFPSFQLPALARSPMVEALSNDVAAFFSVW